MRKLSEINSEFVDTLDSSFKKMLVAKQVENAFARAICKVFGNMDAARFVLLRVQSVYVMRDTRPYKRGAHVDVYLYVYSSDSTVRSELDMRQEWIRIALASENIHYDKMKVYASKLGMKKREPYKNYFDDKEEVKQDIMRHTLSDAEIEHIAINVENSNVRRALEHAMRASRAE